MVFTPSGHSMNGFGTSWCAWHSATTANGVNLPYAYMPYVPDAGTSCGENFVNPAASATAFGNGYFDGFSVVGGHEYAEAQTDPVPSSGWVDSRGMENGDKCAWSSSSTNTTFATGSFAVQPLVERDFELRDVRLIARGSARGSCGRQAVVGWRSP